MRCPYLNVRSHSSTQALELPLFPCCQGNQQQQQKKKKKKKKRKKKKEEEKFTNLLQPKAGMVGLQITKS